MSSIKRNDPIYTEYIKILKAELIPAMGCTEPIAIAYAAAKAREVLEIYPDSCVVEASGNIIKNVKSVVVPNTGGMRGIEAAASAGIVAGDASAQLEVLSRVTEDQRLEIQAYCDKYPIKVIPAHNGKIFYLSVTIKAGDASASVTIEDFHTNITRITKNGQCIFEQSCSSGGREGETEEGNRGLLSVEGIIEFANVVDINDVEAMLSRQVAYNRAIAKEGLTHTWGAQVGRTLLATRGSSIRTRTCAVAAAGSDARMGGCELPVIIMSGSGNQGMTASLPVVEYAEELHSTQEEMFRALVVSNLIIIYQKCSIGRLSAFCGALSAGCGAAAGIAYLEGHRYEVISHTIVNALAILSGMVCDGAKASCAAKIAMAVENGLLGYELYLNGGNEFVDGEGIVKKGVDNTIRTVGRMAHFGMRETDHEILDIMTENCNGDSKGKLPGNLRDSTYF